MRLSLLAVALALAACASHPPAQVPLSGSAVGGEPFVVATLATNACEARTAPAYTAAIVAVERATRYVASGRLDPAQAQVVSTLGHQARADLDAACVNKTLDSTRLAAGEAAVVQMQTILGGVR